MTVVVKDDALAWLARALPGHVEAVDLTYAYAFAHSLNLGRVGCCELLSGPAGVRWTVTFYAPGGCHLLDLPLRREVRSGGRVRVDDGPEAVVINHALFVHQDFQKQGFGLALYGHEEQLYRKWGLREVQMLAADAGRVVWMKKFGFVPQEPEALLAGYRRWAEDRGVDGVDVEDPQELPDEFLLELESIPLYKILL